MTARKSRIGQLRDTFTRERKTPGFIQDQLDYLGSEAHQRQAHAAFRLAVWGLAYAVILIAVILVLAALFHWKLTMN